MPVPRLLRLEELTSLLTLGALKICYLIKSTAGPAYVNRPRRKAGMLLDADPSLKKSIKPNIIEIFLFLMLLNKILFVLDFFFKKD